MKARTYDSTTAPVDAYNFRDLHGQKFGRLEVVGFAGMRKRRSYWKCSCECSETTEVAGTNLTRGLQVSCGCHLREVMSKHGGHAHPLYGVWQAMIARCTNPNVKGYYRYGGRGIKVCQAWMDDLFQFISDIGPRPSAAHSIDRIENNGDYTPENCRWATRKEQQRNQSTNRKLTFGGATKTVTEWAEQVGIPRDVIYDRLREGWADEKCLTTPVRPRRSNKKEA